MSKYKKNKAVALKYNAEEDASPVVMEPWRSIS